MIQQGTRTRQNQLSTLNPPGRSMTKGYTRDLGLTKNVTASCTFGSGQVTAANGTFAAFKAGDVVLVEAVNLNNGYFDVTAIDGANQAFLTLAPAPKAEGAIAATIRTA